MQRRLIGKRVLLVGLSAGATAVLGSALIGLLLGLVPSQAIRGFFGVSYRHPWAAWFADAFLSPFWGLTTRRLRYPGPDESAFTMHYAGLSFGALLVFVALLWAVGRQVRRHVQPTLRQRTGALLVAALVVALIAAVAAAALAHTLSPIDSRTMLRPRGLVTYGTLSYFFGAFAVTFLAGAYCFGVVGLLPQPWAAVLRRGGAFVGVCFLAGGLLFPLFVVSDNLPHAKVAQDFGLASHFSAAAGGLAAPLALQASVSLEQWWISPWINHNAKSAAEVAHWHQLAASTAVEHPRGRLYQHAAALGVAGSLVGAALSLAVVCALVLISWRLCRGASIRTARRGLALGVEQGGAIAFLLAVTLWLSSLYSSSGSPGPNATYWGITAVGLVQGVVTLLLVCGLAGLVYGARQDRHAVRSSEVLGVQAPAPGPGDGTRPTSTSSSPARQL